MQALGELSRSLRVLPLPGSSTLTYCRAVMHDFLVRQVGLCADCQCTPPAIRHWVSVMPHQESLGWCLWPPTCPTSAVSLCVTLWAPPGCQDSRVVATAASIPARAEVCPHPACVSAGILCHVGRSASVSAGQEHNPATPEFVLSANLCISAGAACGLVSESAGVLDLLPSL